MALTAEQVADVEQLLNEHPDWPTSRIRAEAGLSPRDLFAVKRLRTGLGIPEPEKDATAEPTSKRRGKVAPSAEADVLEDVSGPTGPKRVGGPSKKPQSALAPILPRIAQSLVIGIQAGTANLTRGVAPMSQAEAVAVAVPTVRIVDRTVAKYLKKSGKVTPNQEDAGLIALTLLVWAFGWIMASWRGKPRAGQSMNGTMTAGVNQPMGAGADLFAGSEPLGPEGASIAPTSSTPPPTASATQIPALPVDDGDLFAGSEPAAPGNAPTPLRRASGPAAPGPSEAVWQAIMPTDLGAVGEAM